MPDIELRFNKDMLVLSAPIDAMLARQGIDSSRDRQYLNLMEPDVIHDALNLEVVAGANCLVTTTEDITQARLAHVRMDGDAARLAGAAFSIASELKPHHVLAEIGPCDLPLDASSKASLNEHRGQYAEAARAFDKQPIDAFFLSGFTNMTDLKCALMGVAQVSGKPIFASVSIGETILEPVAIEKGAEAPAELVGMGPGASLVDVGAGDAPSFSGAKRACAPMPVEKWAEALAVMQEFGAAVVGFETADSISRAVALVQQAAELTTLPILAQLHVNPSVISKKISALVPLADRDELALDTMETAAVKLYAAGAQFLRATGAATPAYTGALAATVSGLDVRCR